MTTKEYNKLRYHSNPKKTFMTTIRSYKKILTSLGFVVVDPDTETLEKAVDSYLEARPQRQRLDMGAE